MTIQENIKRKSLITLIFILILLIFIIGCTTETNKKALEESTKKINETELEVPQVENIQITSSEKAHSPEDTALQEQKQRESFYNLLKSQYSDNSFPGLPGICSTLDECRAV